MRHKKGDTHKKRQRRRRRQKKQLPRNESRRHVYYIEQCTDRWDAPRTIEQYAKCSFYTTKAYVEWSCLRLAYLDIWTVYASLIVSSERRRYCVYIKSVALRRSFVVFSVDWRLSATVHSGQSANSNETKLFATVSVFSVNWQISHFGDDGHNHAFTKTYAIWWHMEHTLPTTQWQQRIRHDTDRNSWMRRVNE